MCEQRSAPARDSEKYRQLDESPLLRAHQRNCADRWSCTHFSPVMTSQQPPANSAGDAGRRAQEIVIESRSGWRAVRWRELWASRDLARFLVLRDIRVLYRQSVLGYGWAIVRPVVSTILFTVVFGRLAGIPSGDLPYELFALAAVTPWTYFSATLTASALSLVGNSPLLTKVYFPRLIIPLTPVLAKLADLAIGVVIFLLVAAWYGSPMSWRLLLIVPATLQVVLFAAGFGCWLSALALRYRDVRFAMQFFVQILMYAAPVVWPVSLVPPEYRLIYALYPVVGAIEGFRTSISATAAIPWDLLLMGTGSAIVFAVFGALYFRRMERFFTDVA